MLDVNIWSEKTFTKPVEGWPANGCVATSAAYANNGNAPDDSLKLSLKFSEITPDGANNLVGFEFRVVVEEEIGTEWIPMAAQFNPVKGTDQPEQVIVLSPVSNIDKGIAEIQDFGDRQISISRTEGTLGAKFRVCIYRKITNPDRPDVDSFTVTCVVKTYQYKQ